MRKAQVSVDMIVVLAMALIVFGALLSSMSSRFIQNDEEKVRIYAQDVAERLAAQINAVVLEGYGANFSSSVPVGLYDSTPYQLRIIPHSQLVSINWSGNHYSCPVISRNITGNTQIQGAYDIINKNGTIVII